MTYTIGGELYHHGVLGQKWGQRNGPPYPLEGKKHSAAEKNAGWRKSLSGDDNKKLKKKKTKNEVLKNQNEKKNDEVIDKETYEENKRKALKSGSASDILKYKGDLTNQQMQEAINRINYEKQLGQLSAQEVKTATQKVDSIINKIDKARDWTQKGINAYNVAAKIVNAFSDEDNLPIIGEKKPSKDQRAKDELEIKFKKLVNENQELKNKAQQIENEQKQISYRNEKVKRTLMADVKSKNKKKAGKKK